jgi:transposase
MPAAVKLRDDYSAEELRALAGAPRTSIRAGGFGRLRRFATEWIAARRTDGPTSRLSPEQLDELAKIVETGPDRKTDAVVRWRRIDLKRVIAQRFGVDYHPRYVGKLLKKLGFSHMSARPRHPAQDEQIVEAFKKPVAGRGPPVAVETGLLS